MNELFGSFFWASAVRLSAPMFLAAIGETVVQRAGMFNIGIEGMMLVGAFAGVAGATITGSTLAGLGLAAVVTAVIGCLYGVLIAGFRADQVVTGIGFNIVILGATSLLRSSWLTDRITSLSPGILAPHAIPALSDIPFAGPVFFSQSLVVYAACLILPATSFFLFRTRPGLLLRAVGEQATAADSAGVAVVGTRIAAMTFGGLMAGVAGAYLSIVATSGVFIDNMTLGRGFLAIAITIFGRWKPYRVAMAALLFGAAEALQFSSQAVFGGSVSPPLLLMIPFLLAIVAWAIMGGGSSAPGDLGRPFVRSEQ
jgi:general nucleoside transport system permease protein